MAVLAALKLSMSVPLHETLKALGAMAATLVFIALVLWLFWCLLKRSY